MLEFIYSLFERIAKILLYCISTVDNILTIISLSSLLFGILLAKRQKIKTYKRCKKNLKYYIPTRGQITDPCANENNFSSKSQNLTSLFLNKYLQDSETQYFLILADSGVGKTTFLDNLYLKYNKKIIKRNKIIYKTLSYNRTVEDIKKLKRPENKILLLDGFDEDPQVREDYKKRLDEICRVTEDFYKIIITCRTQFFPDSKSEPSRTGRIKFDVTNKSVEFNKFYISLFNDKEINDYLNKKFFHKSNKEKIARGKKIIEKCPDLMVRPMLLANIDILLENDKIEYKYAYEIYEALVYKWIDRENVDNNTLYAFSKKVALHMYHNNSIYIEKKDINKLCKKYNIELSDIEARTRSLLNRNANGSYKFSHKSILEYILALEALDNSILHTQLVDKKFVGYDVTKKFLIEICTKKLSTFQEVSENLYFPSYTLSFINICCYKICNCHFSKCAFSNIRMTGSLINSTNFQKAIFNDISFENVTFQNSNLSFVTFEKTKIFNSKFINVTLKKLTFNNSNLYAVSFSDNQFTNSFINTTNIKKCNFENVNFENANLENVNFRNTNLRNTNWKNVNIKDCIFRGSKLDNAYFERAFLNNVTFKGLDLKNTHLTGACLKNAIFENVNLIGNNLSGIDLKMASLKNVNLKKANLKGANLEGASLYSSSIEDANLEMACLKNIHLNDVSLESVYINSSIWTLKDIVLYQKQLKTADFEYIIMDDNGTQQRLYKKTGNI